MLAFYFDDFRNSTCNVNDLWLSFRGIVSECIQRFVPTIAKSSVHRNPWISRETLRLQRRLKRLKVKARTNVTLKSIVEGTSEQLKQKIICDKEKYYGTILPSFIKTSPERFWRQITPKSSSTSGFMIDGKCVSDETVVCSAFNKFFQSVFTKDNGCLPNFSISLPVISDVVISESGVFNLLLNVDTKKSPGPDKIPNAFLKRYAEWCAKYLYVVFTRSLRDGSLPDDWRTAEIKPLHKSGNKTHIDNYRPVSLTSTSCKILEHIIHKHILSFLEEHKVLTDVQHGFRHRFSTCTQLVETVHDLAQAINEGKQTDIVFMDFRKAFDKVSHNKLIHKLEYYIKNVQILTWIRAYLTNRHQFVTLNNTSSNNTEVASGVPQGSVLGPLLFLLFINDIVAELSVSVKLYADDCILYEKISSVDDQVRLNNDLAKVTAWCEQWQMSINFEKTVFMRITHKKEPLQFAYNVDNVSLSEVREYKYLGLWITNELSWTKHIDTVVANSLRKLFFLRRSLKSSTSGVRLLAYNSYIRPLLEYAVIIWDPFTLTNIKNWNVYSIR